MAAGVFELVNGKGRKYLTGDERDRFVAAARADPRPAVQTFAATLAHTGARISEVLAIRAGDVDVESSEVRIATLTGAAVIADGPRPVPARGPASLAGDDRAEHGVERWRATAASSGPGVDQHRGDARTQRERVGAQTR